MIDTPHIFFEDEMGWTCGTYGEKRNTQTQTNGTTWMAQV